jgi:hypothetical protein
MPPAGQSLSSSPADDKPGYWITTDRLTLRLTLRRPNSGNNGRRTASTARLQLGQSDEASGKTRACAGAALVEALDEAEAAGALWTARTRWLRSARTRAFAADNCARAAAASLSAAFNSSESGARIEAVAGAELAEELDDAEPDWRSRANSPAEATEAASNTKAKTNTKRVI